MFAAWNLLCCSFTYFSHQYLGAVLSCNVEFCCCTAVFSFWSSKRDVVDVRCTSAEVNLRLQPQTRALYQQNFAITALELWQRPSTMEEPRCTYVLKRKRTWVEGSRFVTSLSTHDYSALAACPSLCQTKNQPRRDGGACNREDTYVCKPIRTPLHFPSLICEFCTAQILSFMLWLCSPHARRGLKKSLQFCCCKFLFLFSIIMQANFLRYLSRRPQRFTTRTFFLTCFVIN